MDPALDVIVVGGGLAGLTAARELGHRGRRVLLLEARERLGGRTWVSSFAGVDVEMGGAFVHWSQPHLWAEVTRYGLGIVELPDTDRAFLRRDDGIEELDEKVFLELNDAFELLCAGTEAYLAEPMTIPEGPAAVEADLVSTAERIAALDLDPRNRDLLDALCAGSELGAERPRGLPDDRSVVRPRRLRRADGLRYERPMGARGRNRLAGRRDAPRPARGRASRVRGSRRSRRTRRASPSVRRTVSTQPRRRSSPLPVNALGAVRFDPALSERKREAAEEGLVGLGVKVWAKLAPGSPSTFAAAPDRFPLSFVETVAPTPDGGTVVVGFGPSAAALSPDDPEPVARAIEDLLPGARVEEVGGHDWVRDPLAGETWASYGPGSLAPVAPGARATGGPSRVRRVATSHGAGAVYMDGAIETGLRAGREIEAILS